MQKKGGKSPSPKRAADIIRDAGGQIVGRTRLQKIAYLLEVAGLGDGFEFSYRHYGPFSEDLATAVRKAELLDLVKEEERPATWGGLYSIYSSLGAPSKAPPKVRKELIEATLSCNPVALELAATALFVHFEGSNSPWKETARRKPEKAQVEMMRRAQDLYGQIKELGTPKKLPELA